MKVAVFGGSFNPPHVGHAMVAEWLMWTQQADVVLLVPCYDHPFAKHLAPFRDRVLWCQNLATDVSDNILVDPIEDELPCPSYTINTLRALDARMPRDVLRLVVGADVLLETNNWKDWDAIEKEFPPIVVGRAGYPCPDGVVVFPEVSSSDIRVRLQKREPLNHLLTAGVRAQYERSHG